MQNRARFSINLGKGACHAPLRLSLARPRTGRRRAALMGAATLAGCSGASQHQVIDRNVACSSCHSDEKPVYEGATVPRKPLRAGRGCRSRHREPRLRRRATCFHCRGRLGFRACDRFVRRLDGGEAVVELEDGLWALCLDEGDKLAPSSCASIPRAMRPLSWNCSARTLSAARE